MVATDGPLNASLSMPVSADTDVKTVFVTVVTPAILSISKVAALSAVAVVTSGRSGSNVAGDSCVCH